MARKHLVQWYLEQQNIYFEMLDNIKDFQELLAERKITDEEYQEQAKELEKIKEQYEWLSYVMFLLNKPVKKDARESKETLSWYNTLKGSSKEALLDESRDALADFKKFIKENK